MQVVCGVIINDKNELLLVKKNKGSYKGKWEFPGGKREDETLKRCVEREMKEEIGCYTEAEGLILYDKIMFDKDTPIDLYFYQVELIDEDIYLSDEHSEYKWASYEEIQNMDLLKWDYKYVDKIFEYFGIKHFKSII